MNKKFDFKRGVSLLLALILLFSCLSLTSFATTAESEWQPYFDSYYTEGKAIYLAPGSNDSSRGLSWYSSKASGDPYVEISLSADMSTAKSFSGTAILTPEDDFANKVTVTGLEAGKTYFYRCCNGETKSDIYSFTTSDNKDFSFLYVTDIHVSGSDENIDALRSTSFKVNRVLESAIAKSGSLDLIVSAGDQASGGFRAEYKALVASKAFRSIPFATSIGNHDRKDVGYKYFKNVPNERSKNFTASYNGSDYWFVKGDALFLMIDTNNCSAADHRNFIKTAIAENPDVKWRIAVSHHDLYGGRIERRESENELLRLINLPLFDEFKIDLVLLGHSHYYTISNVMFNDKTVTPIAELDSVTNPVGTLYMVSGSINNPRTLEDNAVPPLGPNVGKSYLTGEMIYNIIDVSENSLTINSYTVESDELFESFTINKTGTDGGHPKYNPGVRGVLLRFVSAIYGFFNNLDNRYSYVEKYDIGIMF